MAETRWDPTTQNLLDYQVEPPTRPEGSSLRAVLLAATGQDVRLCRNCDACARRFVPGMDLTLGELVRAAARDDPRALTCATLWASEDLLLRDIPCTAGLALNSILIALQREAERRGLAPASEGPSP